jgi:8-oxo-(d)GTP phosphatase
LSHTRGQTVLAAGGVVVRRSDDGTAEVVLVHRPRYDDWSLPKGKLETGESELDGALREVAEETGLVCKAGRFLGRIAYVDNRGRPKTVAYWEMEPVAGSFERGGEVDEVVWTTVPDALPKLTYERDRAVLRAFLRASPVNAG